MSRTRTLALALSIPFLLTAAGTVAAQGAGFRLEPSATAVAPGEAVTIEVWLDDPSLVPIGGAQLALVFDSAVYSLTGFEEPTEIPGAVDPDFFFWNGPAPVGSRGGTGCTEWWDGSGFEAVSAVITFPGAGFAAPAGLLFRFELTAAAGAPLGDATISHAFPDPSCLWNGSVIVDADGFFIPTSQPDLLLPVSDVPPVTDLACGSAGGDAMIGWSLGGTYSAIRIRRNGVLLPVLVGGATSYSDFSVSLGAVYEYAVTGVANGLESPAATCTVSITTGVSAPVGLVCSDLGGSAGLEWLNPPIGWQAIEVRRDGVLVQALDGAATSWVDAAAPTGVEIGYDVRGVLDQVPGQSALCSVTVLPVAGSFVRGDANLDSLVNIADPSTTLAYLFTQGTLACADAADVNDSGALDIGDAVYTLAYLFSSGPPPEPPHPVAGNDPTSDALGCGGP